MRIDFRRPTLHGALLLVLVLPCASLAASNEEVSAHINAIGRMYEDLEYERALQQLEFARQIPHSMEEEVTLYLYEGVLLYELGQQSLAKAAFRAALLLRPKVGIPVQVAPKIEVLFETIRQKVTSEVPLLLQDESDALTDRAERALSVAPAQQTSAPSELGMRLVLPKISEWVDAPPVPRFILRAEPLSASAPSRARQKVGLRDYSLIPAITGGTLAVAGVVFWAISRRELSQLRNDDPRIDTMDDVRNSVSRGNGWQTAGISLLSAGAIGLATAIGMHALGEKNSLPLGKTASASSDCFSGNSP